MSSTQGPSQHQNFAGQEKTAGETTQPQLSAPKFGLGAALTNANAAQVLKGIAIENGQVQIGSGTQATVLEKSGLDSLKGPCCNPDGSVKTAETGANPTTTPDAATQATAHDASTKTDAPTASPSATAHQAQPPQAPTASAKADPSPTTAAAGKEPTAQPQVQQRTTASSPSAAPREPIAATSRNTQGESKSTTPSQGTPAQSAQIAQREIVGKSPIIVRESQASATSSVRESVNTQQSKPSPAEQAPQRTNVLLPSSGSAVASPSHYQSQSIAATPSRVEVRPIPPSEASAVASIQSSKIVASSQQVGPYPSDPSSASPVVARSSSPSEPITTLPRSAQTVHDITPSYQQPTPQQRAQSVSAETRLASLSPSPTPNVQTISRSIERQPSSLSNEYSAKRSYQHPASEPTVIRLERNTRTSDRERPASNHELATKTTPSADRREVRPISAQMKRLLERADTIRAKSSAAQPKIAKEVNRTVRLEAGREKSIEPKSIKQRVTEAVATITHKARQLVERVANIPVVKRALQVAEKISSQIVTRLRRVIGTDGASSSPSLLTRAKERILNNPIVKNIRIVSSRVQDAVKSATNVVQKIAARNAISRSLLTATTRVASRIVAKLTRSKGKIKETDTQQLRARVKHRGTADKRAAGRSTEPRRTQRRAPSTQTKTMPTIRATLIRTKRAVSPQTTLKKNAKLLSTLKKLPNKSNSSPRAVTAYTKELQLLPAKKIVQKTTAQRFRKPSARFALFRVRKRFTLTKRNLKKHVNPRSPLYKRLLRELRLQELEKLTKLLQVHAININQTEIPRQRRRLKRKTGNRSISHELGS